MIDYLESFEQRYGKQSKEIVADSGYGSEQNYEYMLNNRMVPYVKFNHGFKWFRLKSKAKVSVEWGLMAIAHNLRKYIAAKLKRAAEVANIRKNSLTIVQNWAA